VKKLLQRAAFCAILAATILPAATPVLAQTAPTIARVENDHVLLIDGGMNFRDLGGYRTAEGRTVKSGVVYRSAELSHVTPEGFAQLKSLGIRSNIDLRSTDERKAQPIQWPADMGVSVHQTDYPMDMAPFIAVFSKGTPTAEETRTLMAGFYKQVPFTFAPQYANLIRQVLDDGAPVVFNCSAGKDRTGVAAALILTLVGVPRETVTQDYLLSNTYYKPSAQTASDDPAAAMFRRLPPDVVQALMGVDARYLDSAFAAIEAREGGWKRYVEQDLGLTPTDLAQLRAKLLL
jgi:protein-tyrosine phosphatase